MSDVRDLLTDPKFLVDFRNPQLSAKEVADRHGCGKTFVLKWRKKHGIVRDVTTTNLSTSPGGESGFEESSDGSKSFWEKRNRPVTFEDARDWIKSTGDDPANYNISVRSVAYGVDMFSNKMSAWPKYKGTSSSSELPLWPVIQPADPVQIVFPEVRSEEYARLEGYKLSLKCGDTQIGFRRLADGSLDPFHDPKAMLLFIEVCRRYQPDSVIILGDFLDLPAQGRFDQEASFAQTTQLAINEGYKFLAAIREAVPLAEIVLIEGNHDLRMQTFIQNNALAAFGLKQADSAPADWPVMSLPFLMRLEELDIQYIDSYPAATHWDNDNTRNIHGTKVNSKGSTMAQYVHELSHLNTWAGHTHRAEVVYRTVLGPRGEPIESYAANPGVLCRTDGGVPSVKGAIGASGVPAKIVEDWHQGIGLCYYNDTESWPQVYRIRNGSTIIDRKVISV